MGTENYTRIMFLALFVGVVNISLNFAANWTAVKDAPLSSFFSGRFIFTFFIGMCSLCGLIYFYTSKASIQSGILLMGTVSIIGGTILGVIIDPQNRGLSGSDWILFCTIVIMYSRKWLILLLGNN